MSYRADKQMVDIHTHGQTQTHAMTIPEGQNLPRVKTVKIQMKTWFRKLIKQTKGDNNGKKPK